MFCTTPEQIENARRNVEILRWVFGAKKVWAENYDTEKVVVWDGETPCDALHWIPSGKPWRTHKICAKPLPDFYGGDAWRIVERLRKQWADNGLSYRWAFADQGEGAGWEAGI